jgi:MFS family permease
VRLRSAALYAGGFLGPFGGGVVVSMLPELGAWYHVSAGTAASSLTAYMLPFAVLLLFSGTLGERWGPLRTVRVAYLVYVVVSLLCLLPGPFWLFLAARGLQGAANAFTTPLLLAAVAQVTPRARLGKALGLFGALQAAGQTSAPLLGGVAADVSWQWAFVAVAGVATALAAIGLPAATTTAHTTSSLRSTLRPSVLVIGAIALVGWGCSGGLSFLVSLRIEDGFATSASVRGLLLTAFGAAGLLTARLAGSGVDRIGARRALTVGTGGAAVLIALTGLVDSLTLLTVLWAAAGVVAQFLLVGANSAALASGGSGRVGVVQAFRFTGAAAAPLLFTPLYHFGALTAFLVAGCLLVLTAFATFAVRPPAHSP